MTRAWLRHPARTVGRSRPCPTRLPRFANVDLAREALRYGYAGHNLTAWPCGQCDGAHITDQADAPPTAEADDCEPTWTTPKTSRATTVTVQGSYL